MASQHNPNDQRSNVKNPNHPAYEADRQNQIKQGNPNPPPPPPGKGEGEKEQKK